MQHDLIDEIQSYGPDARVLVVAHICSATTFVCDQLNAIGIPTAHETPDNKRNPPNWRVFVSYQTWAPDWNDYDHVLWLVREPIKVVYSSQEIYRRRFDVLEKVFECLDLEKPNWPDDDLLGLSMMSVSTLNHRAEAWRLPRFRAEDIRTRVELPPERKNTHRPELQEWWRLAERDTAIAELLVSQTLRYGYDVDVSRLKPREPDLVDLAAPR